MCSVDIKDFITMLDSYDKQLSLSIINGDKFIRIDSDTIKDKVVYVSIDGSKIWNKILDK